MPTLRVLLAVLCALALAPVASASPWGHAQLGDDAHVGGDDPSILAAPSPPPSVPSQAGCRTDFLNTNFSSRGGALPRLLVVHYTVSPNQPGWDDVNLIRGLFNRSSFGASSNYIIDRAGHCAYIVNESAKAWTQTFYNPWAISIEFIATGRESAEWWRSGDALRVGARVFADAAKRWNIPIRWVNPSAACVEPPLGITDHESLDCQNTHTDVKPNFPIARFMALVKLAAAPPRPECQIKYRRDGLVFFKTSWRVCGSNGETVAFNEAAALLQPRLLDLLREGRTVTVKRERKA